MTIYKQVGLFGGGQFLQQEITEKLIDRRPNFSART